MFVSQVVDAEVIGISSIAGVGLQGEDVALQAGKAVAAISPKFETISPYQVVGALREIDGAQPLASNGADHSDPLAPDYSVGPSPRKNGHHVG